MSDIDRFATKYTVAESGCWNWNDYVTPKGYGLFRYQGKTQKAHRVAYQLLKGDLVDGLVIDHLCKNRSCVNPNHLEQVTNKTNLDRGRSFLHHKEKTHCPQGHEYNEGNTYETATGWRQCKICQRSRALARYHKNKNVRP